MEAIQLPAAEVIQYHGERLKWRRQINVEKAQRTDRCLGLKGGCQRGDFLGFHRAMADARAFYGWFYVKWGYGCQ